MSKAVQTLASLSMVISAANSGLPKGPGTAIVHLKGRSLLFLRHRASESFFDQSGRPGDIGEAS